MTTIQQAAAATLDRALRELAVASRRTRISSLGRKVVTDAATGEQLYVGHALIERYRGATPIEWVSPNFIDGVWRNCRTRITW